MTIVKRTIERKQTDHSGTEPDINHRKEKKQRKEVDAGNQVNNREYGLNMRNI
jgi:hypothetical protein